MSIPLPLSAITGKVTRSAKELLGEKLQNIILYGSYARGDYDEHSDIDIMVLADVEDEEIYPFDKKICELTSDLGLEHGKIISVHLKNKRFFEEHVPVLPFYYNVIKEGVMLYEN